MQIFGSVLLARKELLFYFVLILLKWFVIYCALGVEFKDDWKAKDGECEKCEGAGGEFTIERTCVAKTWSCKGIKNTKMTDDCVTYCDSSAGRNIVS